MFSRFTRNVIFFYAVSIPEIFIDKTSTLFRSLLRFNLEFLRSRMAARSQQRHSLLCESLSPEHQVNSSGTPARDLVNNIEVREFTLFSMVFAECCGET